MNRTLQVPSYLCPQTGQAEVISSQRKIQVLKTQEVITSSQNFNSLNNV
jgi:hypothetical protein